MKNEQLKEELKDALTLNVLRHEQVLTVVDDIAEVRDPVAEDNHAGLLRELQVDIDVTVTVDKVVDVRVVLNVALGISHKGFALLAHIWRLLAARALQPRVLGPRLAEPNTPTGMHGREHALAGTIVEHPLDELELLVRVAKAVAMSQKENLTVELGGQGLLVQDDSAFALQIDVGPDVMVAREIVHLNTKVGQFGDLAEKTGIAFRNYVLILIPEVEHVAQKIDGCRLRLDGIMETYQPTLLHPLMV